MGSRGTLRRSKSVNKVFSFVMDVASIQLEASDVLFAMFATRVFQCDITIVFYVLSLSYLF
jgi:hypothetical protein